VGLLTRPAPHPLFKLPDGRFPSAPQRREIDRAVRIAASAFDFQIPESGIQRVTNRRGGLCGAAVVLAFGSIMSAVLLIADVCRKAPQVR